MKQSCASSCSCTPLLFSLTTGMACSISYMLQVRQRTSRQQSNNLPTEVRLDAAHCCFSESNVKAGA
jgi:hypothetical protein